MAKPKERGGKRGGRGGGFQGGFASGPNDAWQSGYGGNGFQVGYNGNNYNYDNGNYQYDNYYNDSQGWYADDSYGNNYNGGYNNGYNMRPFQRGRGRQGYGAYGRGGPGQRWGPRGPKQTVPFKYGKRNAKGKQNGASNGQKQKAKKKQDVTGQTKQGETPTSVEQAAAKKKKKHHSKSREAMYKRKIQLKRRFTNVKQNKNLSQEQQIVLKYLKQIGHDICDEKKKTIHFVLFSKVFSGHRNALKIFTKETRHLLSEKYDNTEEGQASLAEYLQNTKENTIETFKTVFHKTTVEKANIEGMEQLIDEYIGKLTGKTYTNEDNPVPEDYLFYETHSRLEEDFITEFEYRFVYNALECFFFKPHEAQVPTRDLKKRREFFLGNPVIPFIVVESVRAKTLCETVPSPLDKYLFLIKDLFREKTEAYMNEALVYLKATSVPFVSTPISKYLTEGMGNDVIRDLADAILMFDRAATYNKFRMMNYTPHIHLSVEAKEKKFNELVDRMYREILDILIKKEKLEDQKFAEIEPDPVVVTMETDAEAPAPENGVSEEVKMESESVPEVVTEKSI